jgi:hypothetical protein
MNNGYTPREYAYSIAIDALVSAFDNNQGELDDLPMSQAFEVKNAIIKLKNQLADKAKLDII